MEVEPRSMLTKSHAGIFTRLGNRNIKKGITDNDFVKGVSANDILLEVRAQLVVLSSVEQCSFG